MDQSEMPDFTSASKEFPSTTKEGPMSFTAEAVRIEMRERIQETVRLSPGESVKARLRAAAKFIGLPVGRVADHVYGEVRRVEAHEADLIRARHEQGKRLYEARLAAELAKVRAELAASDRAWVVATAAVVVGKEEVGQ